MTGLPDSRSGIDENGRWSPAFVGQREPFAVGNTTAFRHGASSQGQIGPLARNHRRRLLRQIGLRSGDVDPIGKAYLDAYVRVAAKIELLDQYFVEHGLLKPDGEPQPATRLYVQLHNAASKSLGRLEAHLRAAGGDPVDRLEEYISAAYGGTRGG